MELNFSELDNNKIIDSTIHYEKYWDQPNNTKNNPVKRKKVSFDDILTNMNLVVNQNGALQFMTPVTKNTDIQTNGPIIIKKTENIEPIVKHSYIFNKYFKDYRDVNKQEEAEIRIPKTKEEYNRMVMEERIKAFYQKKRIEQIKSKKLLFTHSSDNIISHANMNIVTTQNKLRTMNFN